MYVTLNNGHLKAAHGKDGQYAKWHHEKHFSSGDILKTVTSDEYEKLCEGARYRWDCKKAAASL